MSNLAGLVLIATMVGGQGDAELPDGVRATMEYLVGSWTTEGEFLGEKFKGSFTARWAPGMHCLVMRSKSNVMEATGVCGWDPSSKQLVESWHRADGVRIEHRFSDFSPAGWTGTATLFDPTGKTEGTIRVDKKSEDFFTFTGEAAGKSLVVRTRRVKPSPLDLEKDFGWLIGKWVGDSSLTKDIPELKLKKGTKFVAEQSYEWSLDKKFILFKRRFLVEEKELGAALDLIGYDPESQKIKQWGFYSLGGHGSGVWSQARKGQALRWSTVNPAGQRETGRSLFQRIDDNVFESRTTNVTLDGEPQPDPPPMTLRRVGS